MWKSFQSLTAKKCNGSFAKRLQTTTWVWGTSPRQLCRWNNAFNLVFMSLDDNVDPLSLDEDEDNDDEEVDN